MALKFRSYCLIAALIVGSPGAAQNDRAAPLKATPKSSTLVLALEKYLPDSEDICTLDSTSDEFHAVERLAELRSVEAIPLLNRYITTRSSAFPFVQNGSPGPDFAFYPFAVALARIGMPAWPVLLRDMKKSKPNSLRFALSAHIFRRALVELSLKERATDILTESVNFSESQARRIQELYALPEVGWYAMTCDDFSCKKSGQNR